jgi:hypothetical protein
VFLAFGGGGDGSASSSKEGRLSGGSDATDVWQRLLDEFDAIFER